jgi:hypothetical protein
VAVDNLREIHRSGTVYYDGYIDKTGAFVIRPILDSAFFFSEGFAAAGILDKHVFKYGFIDKSGMFLVQPRFEEVSMFSEGLAG